jgi:hypothetical protein
MTVSVAHVSSAKFTARSLFLNSEATLQVLRCLNLFDNDIVTNKFIYFLA